MTTTMPEQADTLPAEAESAFAEYEGITAKELAETVARYGAALSGIAQKTLPTTDYQQMAREALRGVTYSAPDHYFAVDYTGCIHEAPDRETAIKWAEDFARTANGGAIGSERRDVAAMLADAEARVAPSPTSVPGSQAMSDVKDLIRRLTQLAKHRESVETLIEAATALERLSAERDAAREALAPLARLGLPKRPQGNAGFYSIRHNDISRARAALRKMGAGR